ncbi:MULTISPECIES: GNAT family N-acetyltransferase [Streptomyces]|uniref:GNAT family N-acetyltransferase n=1 Tax=Streptomyces sanyensis TaxID=568869 RepID=A0ABP9BDA1_9ACTN
MTAADGAVRVGRLTAAELPGAAPGLGAVLADAVEDGASVGFLAPLDAVRAAAWWSGLGPDLASGALALWCAREGERIVGTVQLRCETAANGSHRGEIAKLIVHRDARGRGLARRLLGTAEEHARAAGRRLLLLDTQTGSAAERLYRSTGWTPLGTVPGYAADPSGALRPTTFFHKDLGCRKDPGPAPGSPGAARLSP